MDKRWSKLKNYFLAGLIAVLPLWVSYYILIAVFKIAASGAKPFLKTISPLQSSPTLLNILSVLGTVLILLFLGVILTNIVGRRIFHMLERVLQTIPLLSWIYSSIRKLTALFYQDAGSSGKLKRVVMIEYPRKGIFVLGFVTTESENIFNEKAKHKLINVFLPTTPNPTSGFLLMVPKEEVMPVEISTEDAVKLIVSGGIATTGGIPA